MYVHDEATAREYINAWAASTAHRANNPARFRYAAQSQRAAAGLCRNPGDRDQRLAAAAMLEAAAVAYNL